MGTVHHLQFGKEVTGSRIGRVGHCTLALLAWPGLALVATVETVVCTVCVLYSTADSSRCDLPWHAAGRIEEHELTTELNCTPCEGRAFFPSACCSTTRIFLFIPGCTH